MSLSIKSSNRNHGGISYFVLLMLWRWASGDIDPGTQRIASKFIFTHFLALISDCKFIRSLYKVALGNLHSSKCKFKSEDVISLPNSSTNCAASGSNNHMPIPELITGVREWTLIPSARSLAPQGEGIQGIVIRTRVGGFGTGIADPLHR